MPRSRPWRTPSKESARRWASTTTRRRTCPWAARPADPDALPVAAGPGQPILVEVGGGPLREEPSEALARLLALSQLLMYPAQEEVAPHPGDRELDVLGAAVGRLVEPAESRLAIPLDQLRLAQSHPHRQVIGQDVGGGPE